MARAGRGPVHTSAVGPATSCDGRDTNEGLGARVFFLAFTGYQRHVCAYTTGENPAAYEEKGGAEPSPRHLDIVLLTTPPCGSGWYMSH